MLLSFMNDWINGMLMPTSRMSIGTFKFPLVISVTVRSKVGAMNSIISGVAQRTHVADVVPTLADRLVCGGGELLLLLMTFNRR